MNVKPGKQLVVLGKQRLPRDCTAFNNLNVDFFSPDLKRNISASEIFIYLRTRTYVRHSETNETFYESSSQLKVVKC